MSIACRYDFDGYVYARDTETGELSGPYDSIEDAIADHPGELVGVPGGHIDEAIPPISA